jgi:hypothetical protein
LAKVMAAAPLVLGDAFEIGPEYKPVLVRVKRWQSLRTAWAGSKVNSLHGRRLAFLACDAPAKPPKSSVLRGT